VLARWDDRLRALAFDEVDDAVGAVATVGDDRFARAPLDQRLCGAVVADLAGRDHDLDG
jgi:hypothetical protein